MIYDIFGNQVILPSGESRFTGKSLLFQGDSLCGGDNYSYSFTSKTHVDYLKDRAGFGTLYNLSKSNTGFKANTPYIDTLNNWNKGNSAITPDVILVFGNMNDAQSAVDLQLGTVNDESGADTVYGLMRQYIERLLELYPDTPVGFITSPPRLREYPQGRCYGHGYYEQWIEAQRYICEEYSIPFLDLYHNSILRPYLERNRTTFFPKDTTAGVHFNETAHSIIGWQEYEWLNANF